MADGQRPVPFVLEISGSLRPPAGVWESAGAIGLRDFADPARLFELSYYYGEQQGVADNFVRYAEFTGAGILAHRPVGYAAVLPGRRWSPRPVRGVPAYSA